MPDVPQFVGEMDLKFVASPEFEPLNGISSKENAPIIARNALRILTMGWQERWTQLINWSTLSAVFFRRDHQLMLEFRKAIQQGFHVLFEQLKDKSLSETQREQVQLFLSNCLNLLPYSDITSFETLKVPQWVGDRYELVDFQVNLIELTDKTNGIGQHLPDEDRVYAIGLEPIAHKNARSILIFPGTSTPGLQGFMSHVRADLKAFETVGESLYRTGRIRILEWLKQQKEKIFVTGISLGGALSLILAIDQGDKLFRVDAQNPAGLDIYPGKSDFDHWQNILEKPIVVVQRQADDPVSLFGTWKLEWLLYLVIPPLNKKGPNAFLDHFLNYAGFIGTKFFKIDPQKDNEDRRYRNIFLYTLGRGFLYYALVLPFVYVIRPAGLFVWNYIRPIMLLGILALLSIPLISLAAVGTVVTPLLATTLVGAGVLSLGLLAKELWSFVSNKCRAEPKTIDVPNMHAPHLPRTEAMDAYSRKHIIDLRLPVKEAYSYFKMHRCLLKNKEYRLTEDAAKSTEVKKNKQNLLDKIEALRDGVDECMLSVTRAKAALIKKNINAINRFGLNNQIELKKALEDNEAFYQFGKNKG